MTEQQQWLARYRTWAVFGLGRSGVAAANLLAQRGHRVIVSDTRQEGLAEQIQKLAPGVEVVTGRNAFEEAEVVVVSPGLKPSLPIFEQVKQAGLPVISEIELAFDAAVAPFVAITGTDGKTTTTSLAGHMFKMADREHVVAGNIGTPLCEVVEDISTQGVIVAEVSAFQLWSTHTFRPMASVITNVAGDHLDYFDGDFEAYTQAKKAILDRGQAGDWAVLRMEDDVVSSWARDWPGKVCFYGCVPPEEGMQHVLWSDGTSFYGRFAGEDLGCWLEDASALPLIGPHNHANMLSAAALALSQGVGIEAIVRACETFEPLPHRMQRLDVVGGVRFWDDSKATNAHAALVGLRGLSQSYVAIVGGVDKGLDLGAFIEELVERADGVVAIGAIRDRLCGALLEAGFDETRLEESDTLEAAVQCAYQRAREHATSHVVLSPACSSFDMFDSYAHRGRLFQQYVSELERET